MPTSAIQNVGVAAFYHVVSFVCEDTQRYPPTRQFFSSCIEVLGQVKVLHALLIYKPHTSHISQAFTSFYSPHTRFSFKVSSQNASAY